MLLIWARGDSNHVSLEFCVQRVFLIYHSDDKQALNSWLALKMALPIKVPSPRYSIFLTAVREITQTDRQTDIPVDECVSVINIRQKKDTAE